MKRDEIKFLTRGAEGYIFIKFIPKLDEFKIIKIIPIEYAQTKVQRHKSLSANSFLANLEDISYVPKRVVRDIVGTQEILEYEEWAILRYPYYENHLPIYKKCRKIEGSYGKGSNCIRVAAIKNMSATLLEFELIEPLKKTVNRILFLEKLGQKIKEMHSNGSFHYDLSPGNILYNPQIHDIVLIDPGGSLNNGTPGFQGPSILSGNSEGPNPDVESYAILANALLDQKYLTPLNWFIGILRWWIYKLGLEAKNKRIGKILPIIRLFGNVLVPSKALIMLTVLLSILLLSVIKTEQTDIGRIIRRVEEAEKMSIKEKENLKIELVNIYKNYSEHREKIALAINRLEHVQISPYLLRMVDYKEPDLVYLNEFPMVIYGNLYFEPGKELVPGKVILRISEQGIIYRSEDGMEGFIPFKEHPINKGLSRNAVLIYDTSVIELMDTLATFEETTILWSDGLLVNEYLIRGRFNAEELNDIWVRLGREVLKVEDINRSYDPEGGKIVKVDYIPPWNLIWDWGPGYEHDHFGDLGYMLRVWLEKRGGFQICDMPSWLDGEPMEGFAFDAPIPWFQAITRILEENNVTLEITISDDCKADKCCVSLFEKQ